MDLSKLTFVNYHSHDGGSYLDGLSNAKKYIDAAINMGIAGIGITNHGNVSTILEYYDYGKKKQFPVLLGEEFYVEDAEVIFLPDDQKKKNNKYYHLIVIAMNRIGYENLLKLSSLSFSPDRFYTRPRIAFEDLYCYREGLLCTSACVLGPVAVNIVKDNVEKAWNYAKRMKEVFGENWFLEIQPIDIRMQWDSKLKKFYDCGKNDQEKANRGIIEIAQNLKIPLVFGLDSHMVYKADKIVQDVAIQTGVTGGTGWHFYDTYYMKNIEEVWTDFKTIHPYVTEQMFEEMCNNTLVMRDKCNVKLEFKPQLPVVYKDVENKFSKLCELLRKHNKINFSDPAYSNRLKTEIDVIHRNGKIDLLDYFFVLEDLVSWCKKNEIVVGPGRGSAAGCLLAYALDITSIDPIKYGLLFERFLSLPRIQEGTLPDIDLDFSNPDRAKEYLRDRYGEEYVFSIGTVQEIKIKQAWTDVCRVVLGDEFSYFDNKELSRGLPGTGPSANLELILEGTYNGFLSQSIVCKTEEQIQINKAIADGVLHGTYEITQTEKWIKWINTHKDGRKIYDIMMKILGLPRQPGIHACALAISKEPMNKLIPTCLNKGTPVTQFTAPWCEYAGIVKIDILGLNTLKDFQECVKMIRERKGININIYDIPVDDKKVYSQFNLGATDTVFQFNTPLQKHLLKEIGVGCLLDLAVVTAIARPGPLGCGMVQDYINGKRNSYSITYDHPVMKGITGNFHGTLIFQEQIMSFFHKIGGLSLVESEQVRRAISKYKADLMKKYEQRFIEYTTTELKPVLTQDQASLLWQKILKYCAYSFNLSHAVAYAYVGYVCQWLKTHYPLEWWCAVLKNSSGEDFKEFYSKVPVDLVLPDINISKQSFYIDDADRIVIPLSRIKHVGDKAIEEIVASQSYINFDDFFIRIPKRVCKKHVVLNLILSGCFDRTDSLTREQLVDKFFQLRGEERPKEYTNLDMIRLSELETEALEFRSLDYYKIFPHMFRGFSYFREAREVLKGHSVSIGGKVIKKVVKKTKNNNNYCRIHLYNDNDEFKITFWDRKLEDGERYNKVVEGNVVRVIGEIDEYEGRKTLTGKALEIVNF